VPESFTRAEIECLVEDGRAEKILTDDPWSPVRYEGRWLSLPDDLGSDTYRPVAAERAAGLEQMWRALRGEA